MLIPARGYATRLGAIAACAGYKLAPEITFSAPMHSAWEATALLTQPQALNYSPLKGEHVDFDPCLGIVGGGASTGAQITTVIAGVSAGHAAKQGELNPG